MQTESEVRGALLSTTCQAALLLAFAFAWAPGCSDGDDVVPGSPVERPTSRKTVLFLDVTLAGWPPTIQDAVGVQLPVVQSVPLARRGFTLRQDGPAGTLEALALALAEPTYELAFLPLHGETCPCVAPVAVPRTVRIPRHPDATHVTLLDPEGQQLSMLALPPATDDTLLETAPTTTVEVATLPSVVPCPSPLAPHPAPAIETGTQLQATFPTLAFPAASLLPEAILQPLADALSLLSPTVRAGLRSVDRSLGFDEGLRCSAGHLTLDGELTQADERQRRSLTRALAFCATLGLVADLGDPTGSEAPAWLQDWQTLWTTVRSTPPGATFMSGFVHPLGRQSIALDIATTLAEVVADPDRVAFYRRADDAFDQRITLLRSAGLLSDAQATRARCAIDEDAAILRLAIAGVGETLPVWLNGKAIATIPPQGSAGYTEVLLPLKRSELALLATGNRLAIVAGVPDGDLDDLQLRGLQLRGRGGGGFADAGSPVRLGDGDCPNDPNCQGGTTFYLPTEGGTYERIFDGWGGTP